MTIFHSFLYVWQRVTPVFARGSPISTHALPATHHVKQHMGQGVRGNWTAIGIQHGLLRVDFKIVKIQERYGNISYNVGKTVSTLDV